MTTDPEPPTPSGGCRSLLTWLYVFVVTFCIGLMVTALVVRLLPPPFPNPTVADEFAQNIMSGTIKMVVGVGLSFVAAVLFAWAVVSRGGGGRTSTADEHSVRP